jgi:CubicO group peptidase (beta-lactamase class C family)
MRAFRVKNLTMLIVAFGVFAAAARSQVPAKYKDAVERSREIIAATMEKQHIPGLSIAVLIDGKIIWSEGFGYSDLESRIKASPSTKFRIASVSKLFTAALMARLYEQGKFDVNAPIQTYLPDFPDKGYLINARQLVGHLSGIRHYRRDPDPAKDEFFNRTEYYPHVIDGFKIFRDDPLDFPPGTKFGYSSFGYAVLSAMLEKAAGDDFLSVMRREVFLPLKMPNSSADDNRKIITGRSRFYSLSDDGTVINAPYIDRSYSWAGGGFLSNAEDLVRFGAAHYESGFLKEDTLRTIFTSQKTSDGKETGTGWAWRIGKDKAGRDYYYHPGENVGGRSYLWMYPKEKVVIAMLHNLTGANLGSITEISRLFVEERLNKNR